ncbi:transcriptional regulator, TetR family [Veillonellaceae bacterium DNF00751]|uniref:TetR/AcrR family transcriptional regulator n=1 Tax=uncultured Megasphaera sp. TaxID=165188 RepID=UPI0007867324|nr:TetR/AcrR family transcriptional regulator [uncultured Megasphaera sp.]KXB92880.1 transcriptional regulator, TetR family [Veillonellaceae bacterium DNF00751]
MCKNKRLPAHVRKLDICIAGKEVFLMKSFPKTTMEDVAKKAGISKDCLYNYYKNTYEILYDLVAYYKYNIIEKTSLIIDMYGEFEDSDMIVNSITDMIFNEKEIRGIYIIFLIEVHNNEKLKKLYRKIKIDSVIKAEILELIESMALSIEFLDITKNSNVFNTLSNKLKELQLH